MADLQKTHQQLEKAGLKDKMEVLIMATQHARCVKTPLQLGTDEAEV